MITKKLFCLEFRKCDAEENCKPYYEVHDEVDRDICKNDLTKSKYRNNQNRRVMDLFAKYFELGCSRLRSSFLKQI